MARDIFPSTSSSKSFRTKHQVATRSHTQSIRSAHHTRPQTTNNNHQSPPIKIIIIDPTTHTHPDDGCAVCLTLLHHSIVYDACLIGTQSIFSLYFARITNQQQQRVTPDLIITLFLSLYIWCDDRDDVMRWFLTVGSRWTNNGYRPSFPQPPIRRRTPPTYTQTTTKHTQHPLHRHHY